VIVGGEGDNVAAVAVGSGASWTRGRLPADVSDLFGVSCPSATVCVANGETFVRGIGGNPVIIYSTNGGTSWSTSAVPAGLGGQLTVSCSSASKCVAGGGGADLDVTTDGGKVWAFQASPSGVSQVFQLSCPPGGSGCVGVGASGENEAMILQSSGTTWTATADEAAGEAGLRSVACTTTSDCVIVGDSPSPIILTKKNGGTSWTTDTVPSGISQLSGVSCVSATACTAVGGNDLETAGAVTGSITTGKFALATPPAGDGELTGVTCVSGSKDCLAAGYVGTTLATALATSSDSGSKWTAQSLPPAPFPLASVSCGAPGVCVAVGTSASGGMVDSTRDGGAVWTTKVIPAVNSLSSVACSSASDCEAVGTGHFGAQFLATTNGGTSWTVSLLTSSTTMDVPVALSCRSSSDCVVLGAVVLGEPPDLTTFSTTNGGKKWTDTSTSLAGDALNSLSCSSTADCVLVGNGGTEGGPFILTTTTFGATWTSATVPTSPTFFTSLVGVSCASTKDCVVVGDAQQNDVLTTTDGGTAWTEKPYTPTVDDSLYAVSCFSTADCVMVGLDNLGLEPGAIETTTDGGSAWTNVTAPAISFKLLSVSCWSATACVAVGDDSTQHGSVIISSVAPLRVTTASLPSGKLHTAYHATMKASGGATPYTWKLAAGSKPPGLALSSAGVWSGKPTKAGTYSFTLQVTDKFGAKLTKALKIVVAK
jgi:photosystem II stability/assembly factor-like uncharacterized protein